MNLLPKSHQEFGQTDYWNKFFAKRGKEAFEWYGEYPELCGQLHKYIKIKDKILVVGCGNSKLSMDMYDIGFGDITNIDISKVVIKQMRDMNRKKRPDMKYIHMDATAMHFNDGEFSVVLDKGTLDALMTDDSEEVKNVVSKYVNEINRVLRNGGRYVCISLLQGHILSFLLEYFPTNSFMLRIVRCIETEQKTAENASDGATMPVFAIIATKFNNLSMQILEICMAGEKMQRLSSTKEVVEEINSVQKVAIVFNGLNKSNIAGLDEVSIDLYEPGTESPRYTVHVLDRPPARGNGKYAAFIVPQGREVEWLFSTPKGRNKLLYSANHNRLAIVTMHRGQIYKSWDDVKNELAESIKSLAPHNLKNQIPYLSLGLDVGKRETLFQGTSNFSGDYIVEDVEGLNKTLRRLIFLSNQSVIQSESLIKTANHEGNVIKTVDHGYLSCLHHQYMAFGAYFSCEDKIKSKGNVLVVGLGGGGLCMFIHNVLRNVIITAVEIDSSMLEVAEKFFDLKQSDNLNVVIEDGITYIADCAKSGKHFDAILFDVDSKDLSLGMSCPPKTFLEPDVISNVCNLIGENGMFVLNLVCRDEAMRENVLKDIKEKFRSSCSYKLIEDVNEVIYSHNRKDLYKLDDWISSFNKSCKNFNKLTKDIVDEIDLEEFLKDLRI